MSNYKVSLSNEGSQVSFVLDAGDSPDGENTVRLAVLERGNLGKEFFGWETVIESIEETDETANGTVEEFSQTTETMGLELTMQLLLS